jgi:hypothetical protein
MTMANKINKEQAIEMLEAAQESLQNNGYPAIYRYEGRIDISRGDRFGTAEPVYNHEAEILVDTETLKVLLNPYDYDRESAVEALMDMVNEE